MTQGPDPWQEAMQCLETLLSLPESEHESYLHALATAQPELHARIHALLKADYAASSQSFLDPSLLHGDRTPTTKLTAGLQLGQYQLLKPIGTGGMGEVWLARRSDGLYEGEVAIKVLNPEFSSTTMRDRFRREAQILGRLKHPNISRLLDAGIANDFVYLVLEYVDGQPIDRWCDERQLSINDRVKLFISLCEAVTHAHVNLVVHRDLKPTNVLVDDNGKVKLLDFGIGKLIERDQPITAAVAPSELTQLSGRIFTAEYASPEQITGTAITTATDVFALGSLLYFILCGKRAFAADTVQRTEHAVLSQDPTPLSTAARTATAEALKARATTAKKLQHEVSGDLEHIVNQALRKSAQDRYSSVQALIDDLRRYLAHQPVLARIGSRSYLLHRFIQRHRVAVMTTTGVVLSLLLGMAGVLWKANVANEQARIAQAESQKANAVKEFLINIFNHNSTKHRDGAQARNTTAEQLLEIASEQILTEPGKLEFESHAELLVVLSTLNGSLGNVDRNAALQRKLVQLLTQELGKSHLRTINAQLNLAKSLNILNKHDEVKAIAEAAIAELEAAGAHQSKERAAAELLLGQRAYDFKVPNDPIPKQHFRTAIGILEQHPPSLALIQAHTWLSDSLTFDLYHAESAQHAMRAIELAIQLFGPDSTEVATGYRSLVYSLLSMEQFEKAETYAKRAIEIDTRSFGEDSSVTLYSRSVYTEVLLAQGLHRAAAQETEEALRAYQKRSHIEKAYIQYNHASLAFALQSIGDFERARNVLNFALSVPATASDQMLVMLLNCRMASLQLEMRDVAAAQAFAQRAFDSHIAESADIDTQNLQLLHVEILAAAKKFAQAEAAFANAVQRMKKPTRVIQHQLKLTKISVDRYQHRYQDVINGSQALLNELANRAAPHQWWVQEETVYRYLAEAQRAIGKIDQSCQSLSKALALRAQHALPSDPRTEQTRKQLTECR